MKRTDNRLMVLQTNDKRATESECEKKTQKTTIKKKKKTSPKKKEGKERKEGSNTKERRFTGPTQTRVRKREGR